MGHLNFQHLVLLRKNNMVNGLPYIKVDDELCEECIFWKQHRGIFLNRTWKPRDCIALIH
jgi:hypothetical protein